VGRGIRFVAYFRVSMDRSGLDLQAQRETVRDSPELLKRRSIQSPSEANIPILEAEHLPQSN